MKPSDRKQIIDSMRDMLSLDSFSGIYVLFERANLFHFITSIYEWEDKMKLTFLEGMLKQLKKDNLMDEYAYKPDEIGDLPLTNIYKVFGEYGLDLMLTYDVDPTKVHIRGFLDASETVLEIAAENGDYKTIWILVEDYNMDINGKNGNEPILDIASRQFDSIFQITGKQKFEILIKFLLKHRATLTRQFIKSAINSFYQEVLDHYSEAERASFLELFIEYGHAALVPEDIKNAFLF